MLSLPTAPPQCVCWRVALEPGRAASAGWLVQMRLHSPNNKWKLQTSGAPVRHTHTHAHAHGHAHAHAHAAVAIWAQDTGVG
eukprot:4078907-Alexandrium_andersonii.AAC.1